MEEAKLTVNEMSPEEIQKILKERAELLAQPVKFESIEIFKFGHQIVKFKIDKSYYGIDLKYLKEIKKVQQLTMIPNTPSFILGLIQVHGEITPVIDLLVFYGLKRKKTVSFPLMIIVIEMGKYLLGIPVEDLDDVETFSEAQLQPIPDVLSQVEIETTMGMIVLSKEGEGTQRKGESIIIIDAEALINHNKLRVGRTRKVVRRP